MSTSDKKKHNFSPRGLLSDTRKSQRLSTDKKYTDCSLATSELWGDEFSIYIASFQLSRFEAWIWRWSVYYLHITRLFGWRFWYLRSNKIIRQTRCEFNTAVLTLANNYILKLFRLFSSYFLSYLPIRKMLSWVMLYWTCILTGLIFNNKRSINFTYFKSSQGFCNILDHPVFVNLETTACMVAMGKYTCRYKYVYRIF